MPFQKPRQADVQCFQSTHASQGLLISQGSRSWGALLPSRVHSSGDEHHTNRAAAVCSTALDMKSHQEKKKSQHVENTSPGSWCDYGWAGKATASISFEKTQSMGNLSRPVVALAEASSARRAWLGRSAASCPTHPSGSPVGYQQSRRQEGLTPKIDCALAT